MIRSSMFRADIEITNGTRNEQIDKPLPSNGESIK